MSALPKDCPPCGVVGCKRPVKSHTHVGAVCVDERIVVTAKLPSAPGWAYTDPHGVVVRNRHGRVTVQLDGGEIKETSEDNVVRERLYRSPTGGGFKPLHRPHPPLISGPWEELTLGEDSA